MQMPTQTLRRLRALPPFPLTHLKGVPVFWDDFNSGPGGFLKQALSVGDTIAFSTNIIKSNANRWNFADGNEYSAYVTSEASFWGQRSLRIGGNQLTYNTSASGDVGVQDAAAMVAVPSGIIGIEYVINFGNAGQQNVSPKAFRHLLSIERRQFVKTNPSFYELWTSLEPLASNIGSVTAYNSSGTPSVILSDTIPDSNGQFSYNGFSAGDTVNKGTDASWHRFAVTADMNVGRYLDVWFDRFYFDLRSRGTGQWRTVSGSVTAPIPMQDGIYRFEFHAMKNGAGSAFDPYFYIDAVCVTDESGFIAVS